MEWVAHISHIYLATLVISVLSGLIPVINIEFYLVSVATLSTAPAAPIILLTTLGQMIAKYVLYLSGQGVVKLPIGRHQKSLDRVREALERRRGSAHGLVLVSAITGLPPFYAMSIVAGALRLSLAGFLVVGSAGRLLRFSVFFLFPQFVKEWL